jgi:Flp pilus assembly protein TadB
VPSTTYAPSWSEDVAASAGDRLRERIRDAVRSLRTSLSRTLRSLSDTVGSSAPLVKALPAMIGKDRGFGFYWLVAAIAIALAIGLLVALILSPVVALLAALIAGIWYLRKRAAHNAQSAQAAAS